MKYTAASKPHHGIVRTSWRLEIASLAEQVRIACRALEQATTTVVCLSSSASLHPQGTWTKLVTSIIIQQIWTQQPWQLAKWNAQAKQSDCEHHAWVLRLAVALDQEHMPTQLANPLHCVLLLLKVWKESTGTGFEFLQWPCSAQLQSAAGQTLGDLETARQTTIETCWFEKGYKHGDTTI